MTMTMKSRTPVPAKSRFLNLTLGFMAIYYVITGLWPIFHMPSFLLVTGPKTDLWLVKTVGLLAATIGITVAGSVFRDKVTSETLLLFLLAALSFVSIDVYYALSGVISRIYLCDAAVEIVMIAVIAVSFRNIRHS